MQKGPRHFRRGPSFVACLKNTSTRLTTRRKIHIRAAQVRLAQLYGHLGNIALARHWSALAASRSPLVEDSCDLPGSAAASDPTEEAIFLRRMLELVE